MERGQPRLSHLELPPSLSPLELEAMPSSAWPQKAPPGFANHRRPREGSREALRGSERLDEAWRGSARLLQMGGHRRRIVLALAHTSAEEAHPRSNFSNSRLSRFSSHTRASRTQAAPLRVRTQLAHTSFRLRCDTRALGPQAGLRPAQLPFRAPHGAPSPARADPLPGSPRAPFRLLRRRRPVPPHAWLTGSCARTTPLRSWAHRHDQGIRSSASVA